MMLVIKEQFLKGGLPVIMNGLVCDQILKDGAYISREARMMLGKSG